MKHKLLAIWAAGGVMSGLALVAANLLIRWQEAQADQPQYLSAQAKENVLRLAARAQGCCEVVE